MSVTLMLVHLFHLQYIPSLTFNLYLTLMLKRCNFTTNVSIDHDMIDACVRPDKDYLKLINFCVKG